MSRLRSKFSREEFIITCELSPPKGTNLQALFSKANMLKNNVDAFNLTDSAAARMTMDPVAAGYELLKKDIEPIVQVTSRDKNRLAIQGGMLGAEVLGIPNVVIMGGDPPSVGDHPEAKGVNDLFASQIIEAAMALNSGRDLAGNEIKGATHFFIGSVFNPGAKNLDAEIENTQRKLDAGAQFFQTQAIYEVDSFERFMEKLAVEDLNVLAGVIPIKSMKMANYMNERVPGIYIPSKMIERIEQAESDDNLLEVSLDITAQVINELRGKCKGIHIMAIGWEKHIPALLQRAGIA